MLKVSLPKWFTTSIKTPEARCGSPRRKTVTDPDEALQSCQNDSSASIYLDAHYRLVSPSSSSADRSCRAQGLWTCHGRQEELSPLCQSRGRPEHEPSCLCFSCQNKKTYQALLSGEPQVSGRSSAFTCTFIKTYLLHKTHFCWGWVLSFFFPIKMFQCILIREWRHCRFNRWVKWWSTSEMRSSAQRHPESTGSSSVLWQLRLPARPVLSCVNALILSLCFMLLSSDTYVTHLWHHCRKKKVSLLLFLRRRHQSCRTNPCHFPHTGPEMIPVLVVDMHPAASVCFFRAVRSSWRRASLLQTSPKVTVEH